MERCGRFIRSHSTSLRVVELTHICQFCCCCSLELRRRLRPRVCVCRWMPQRQQSGKRQRKLRCVCIQCMCLCGHRTDAKAEYGTRRNTEQEATYGYVWLGKCRRRQFSDVIVVRALIKQAKNNDRKIAYSKHQSIVVVFFSLPEKEMMETRTSNVGAGHVTTANSDAREATEL